MLLKTFKYLFISKTWYWEVKWQNAIYCKFLKSYLYPLKKLLLFDCFSVYNVLTEEHLSSIHIPQHYLRQMLSITTYFK